MQPVGVRLPFLDNTLFRLGRLPLFPQLLLHLGEPLHLVVALGKLLNRILVLFFEECLQLFSRKLRVEELVDLYFGQIDDFGVERVAQDFVVYIVRLLGDRKHVSLRHVILDPEVVIVENSSVVERVLLGEQVSHELPVLPLLRRVGHVLYHEGLLY